MRWSFLLQNLGHLIRVPYGCGEQNMINFVPNIYVMRYLKASGQDNAKTSKQLISNMLKGNQCFIKGMV